MKLHLPASLFRSVLAAMSLAAALTCAPVANAADLHADVSLITYTDFGQNMGRYAVGGNVNALLSSIRETEGGVTISYTGGQESYTLEHGMIDFSSVTDNGWGGAIGYNFVASATHVATADPTFTANAIGSSYAINYKGIEYATSSTFRHATGYDYKITRLSKLVTDVATATVYSGSTSALTGELLYRAGAGSMFQADTEGNRTELTGGYITGGIDTIDQVVSHSENGDFSTRTYVDYSSEGVNETQPLPFMGRPGDSGSPTYVWNEETGQYEYLNAASSIGGTMTQFRGNTTWTNQVMDSYNKEVTIGADSTIYLGAIDTAGDTITDGSVSTTLYSGKVTNFNGDVLATYNGVQSGINTWKDLSGIKDKETWYSYDNDYLNASWEKVTTGTFTYDLSYADLCNNDNLVIKNSSASAQYVELQATVDLGIGYVQFSKGEGMESANFIVQSDSSQSDNFLLNSAGYVVDEGVSVHLKLTNPSDYMREWRKVGAGDLYIEGSGNNDAFLNLGGSGTTYLDRDNGYAAYNVLVNTGSTVVISDISQIQRDLTFGNGGGTLDMNGQSMVWNNDNAASASGFTIHALDEQAIITNTAAGDPIKGGGVTLTWTQDGEQTWLGSFVDTTQGSLKFQYWAADDARLTMHSIHTNLSHNSGSGIEVLGGTLALEGTNTIHGTGSLNGIDLTRYASADDWHYADVTSNVTVDGGTFELGSHARLTGTVTVNSGTFVMREGVKHQMEYIEGGQTLEDTNRIRDYFGLKGNVSLNEGAAMKVQFSEGTDSTLTYAHRITGAGCLSVEAGTDGGILRLEGNNTLHTGSKTVVSGGVYASGDHALGTSDSSKWLIEEKGWLASDSFTSSDTILEHIDSASTGVLALTTDITDEISLTDHQGLIIGAMAGTEVHYGTATESLSAVNGKWTLGGGGGTLIVDFLLEGNHELVLGNADGKGHVHLTNTANTLSGNITLTGAVTLSYEEGALGTAGISLSYGSRVNMVNLSHLGIITSNAAGALLVDNFATADLDLSTHKSLTLSSASDCTYSGNITLAEGADYHFGGNSDSTFTVTSTLEAGHGLVVDGQGYTGGTVVLEQMGNIDGAVTVRGYDSSAVSTTTGDTTLLLHADNGLANASSVTVENNGAIDLAGTNQQMKDLTVEATGTVKDSSTAGNATLQLTGDVVLNGTLDVALVSKTGNGDVTLGGTNNATRFEVQGGTVTLTSGTATHTQGTLAVSNATLDLGHQKALGTIELGEGASLVNTNRTNYYGEYSITTLHVKGNSSLDYRDASGNDTGTSYATTSISTLRVDGGSSLAITATPYRNAALSIQHLEGEGDISVSLNKNGATGSVQANAASFANSSQNYSGHLSVTSDCSASVYFASFTSFGKGTVTLDGVTVSVGTANLASTAIEATLDIGSRGVSFNTPGSSNSSGNKNLYFSSLSGSGRLSGSNMSFSGDLSAFSGTIYGTGTTSYGGSGVNYHTLTGNNSAEAIQLFGGSSAQLYYSGTHQFQYEDDVILNATATNRAGVTQAGTGTLVISQANTSTGALTINAGGTVELAETGSWAGSLAGSGTLVNKSSAAVFSSSTFSGSLALAEGSGLTLTGSTYSLDSGNSLSVFEVDGATTMGATLTASSLVLNGGELVFSANTLQDSTHAVLLLSDTSVSMGSSLTGAQSISISDTTTLLEGNYLLASGDWSALNDAEFNVSGVAGNLTSTITASSSGLLLSLTQAAGTQSWSGTTGHSSWSAETFGTATATSGVTTTYFTDAATSKDVTISGSVEASALIFNAKDDYALTPESGATLSATSLTLMDSGKVTLGNGVTISGTTTLSEGSEVEVRDFSTLSGSVVGHGTVTIDAGAADGNIGTMSAANKLDTLKIVSGRYNEKNAVKADHVVVEGGQFYIWSTATYNYDLSLSGNGWTDNSDAYANAALRAGAGKAQLGGTVTLESNVTVAVSEGTELWMNSDVRGKSHTLTKTGGKLLWMTAGDKLDHISFDAANGELRLGGSVSTQLSDSIGALTVRNGAELSFCAADSTLHGALSLEAGATIDLTSSGNNNLRTYTFTGDVALNKVSTQTEVLLSSANQRNVVWNGTVSGDATLAVRGNHSNAFSLTLNNTENNFSGGITVGLNRTNVTINLAGAGAAGSGTIALGNASALLNVAGNTEGGYDEMTNTISGTGKLTLTKGMLALSGTNNYSGGTTVADGASLMLGNASAAGSGSIALSNEESSLVYAGTETGTASTFANEVTGAGSVTVASGKVNFSTAKGYTGATTVETGAELTVSAATSASSHYVVRKDASLKLRGEGSLTVSAPASATALISEDADATTGSVTLSTNHGSEAGLENATLTGSALTATDATERAEVSSAALSVSASAFSVSNAALVNTNVTLADTELSLNDVVLASGSAVAGLSAEVSSVSMADVTFMLDDSLSYVDADAASLYGTTYAGKTVRVYSVNNFSNVTLSGGLLLDVSALTQTAASESNGYDYLAFDFSASSNNVSMADDFVLRANIGGATVSGIQSGSSYLFEASSDAVPEPASSALALLGLGALALRRRRK